MLDAAVLDAAVLDAAVLDAAVLHAAVLDAVGLGRTDPALRASESDPLRPGNSCGKVSPGWARIRDFSDPDRLVVWGLTQGLNPIQRVC